MILPFGNLETSLLTKRETLAKSWCECYSYCSAECKIRYQTKSKSLWGREGGEERCFLYVFAISIFIDWPRTRLCLVFLHCVFSNVSFNWIRGGEDAFYLVSQLAFSLIGLILSILSCVFYCWSQTTHNCVYTTPHHPWLFAFMKYHNVDSLNGRGDRE